MVVAVLFCERVMTANPPLTSLPLPLPFPDFGGGFRPFVLY